MAGDTTIIRTGSEGSLSIETPEGQYTLSAEECRQLLFFSRRILLRDTAGTIPGDAIAYIEPETESGGERRIIIETPCRYTSLLDRAFVAVANGRWAAAMMQDCKGVRP